MRLAPAPGLKVRDPATGLLIPAEGIEVGPNDFNLLRMYAQGDLVEVEVAVAATAVAADESGVA
jgi:hypothetical protein